VGVTVGFTEGLLPSFEDFCDSVRAYSLPHDEVQSVQVVAESLQSLPELVRLDQVLLSRNLD
jgi:hypothetical protein